jgi:hypothetical protein
MKNILSLLCLIPFLVFGQTQIGDDINGENEGDFSGRSVSISGDGSIIAIGGTGNNGNGIDSGHARMYKNIGGVWNQIGDNINGSSSNDKFGNNLNLSSDGNIIAISASGSISNNGSNSGNVYIYIYIYWWNLDSNWKYN